MKTERQKTRRRRALIQAYLVPVSVGLGLLLVGGAMGIVAGRAMGAEPAEPELPGIKPGATVIERVDEPEPTEELPRYSDQELEMLALVIYQEAGSDACSDTTRYMVGEVVLNRVADGRYPGTLYEVITQRAQYGRLYWTGLVWPERASLPQEAHAIERAYDTAANLLTGSVQRLLPEDTVFQAEFEQGAEVVVYQDGLYFCR